MHQWATRVRLSAINAGSRSVAVAPHTFQEQQVAVMVVQHQQHAALDVVPRKQCQMKRSSQGV